MSSSGSTRDLAKAVNLFMTSPTLPLPDDIIHSIEAYTDKHADYDQSTSDLLQDDLLASYARSVQGQSALHHAAFLAILRQLRPAIRSPAHVLQWWDKVVSPMLARLGEERAPSAEVLSDIGQFLVPDDSDDEPDDGSDVNREGTPFVIGHCLAQKWLDAYGTSQCEGCSTSRTKESPVQDILVLFGKKKPREFFTVLDDFFVQKKHRTGVITLLSEFFHNQPPHLHLIIKTPLFESLLRCLQVDSSTAVIALALTCLTMLLPSMPGSIVPYLPSLFSIYARVLFWDREHAAAADDFASTASPSEQSSMHHDWEKCSYPAEDDSKVSEPTLLRYFNVLYGLYPLNFMDYIRKPQRYLRHANASDDIEVQPSEIRDRSEKFRRCHVLHPNFYSLTIESEKTDFGRWMRSATADVVAECVSLCTPPVGDIFQQNFSVEQMISGGAAGAAGTAGTAGAADARLSTTASGLVALQDRRRSSQLSHAASHTRSDSGADSPTLLPLLSQSASRTDLQGLMESNKAIKTGMYPSGPNDSVPSLSLSHHDVSVTDRSAAATAATPMAKAPVRAASTHLHHEDSVVVRPDSNVVPAADDSGTLAEMRRQILLLQNDLSFERYMVQQHLAHIGALRRSSVRQAVTESETQELIIANRTLKRRLEEAKKMEAQVKKEAEMSRNRHKAWGDSLADKLKVLREEQKKWTADKAMLQQELQVAHDDNARLLALVCEAEVRELKAKQDMQMLESDASEMDKLKGEIKALAVARNEKAQLQQHIDDLQQEVDRAENMLAMLAIKAEAREDELARTRGYYEQQIATLNTMLAAAQRSGPAAGANSVNSVDGANLDDVRAQMESALAASRAKHLELQKNHTRLMRKYKVLESKNLERAASFEDHGFAGTHGSDLASTLSDAETEAFRPGLRGSIGGSSAGSGASSGRLGQHYPQQQQQQQQQYRQRVASDAGSYDTVSTGPGPAMSSPISFAQRPSSPTMGGPRADAAPVSVNPQAERYYGRGGVQNSLRKERKDKKPASETADKKDNKKTGTGMRGIRGFM